MLTEISIQLNPLIALEHLSLYTFKLVALAVSGKADHGRRRQSQVQPGTARYSQVQC